MRTISQNSFLIAAIAGFAVACSGSDTKEERPSWACERVSVPMGQAVECTSTVSSALISNDGVSTETSSDGESIFWYCAPGTVSLLCPPITTDGTGGTTGGSGGTSTGSTGSSDGTSTGGGSGGTSTDTGGTGTGSGTGTSGGSGGTGGELGAGTATGGGTGGSGTGGTGGTGGGAGGTGGELGAGTATGGGTGGNGGGGNGGGNGNGNGSGGGAGGLVPECAYGPDLSYCPPPISSDGTGGSTGGAGGTGADAGAGGNGNGNGNGNGGTGGNGSKADGGVGTGSGDGSGTGGSGAGGGTNGGTAGGGNGNGNGNGGNTTGGGGNSSSDGSGKPGNGGGSGYTCVESGGKTTCRSNTPECVAGTKPLPCGACVPVGSEDGDCAPPTQGGCWITGGGWVGVTPVAGTNGKATFGGNGKPMKKGNIQGEWNHVDHTGGGHIHGQVRYLVCRHVDEPGPGNPSGPKKDFKDNQAYFGGPARFSQPNGAWTEGYWFDAFVEDHGEPGNKPGPGNHGSKGPDEYRITLRKTADPAKGQSGTLIYEIKQALPLGGGNIQLHPPNAGHPATASSLPQWVSLEP